MEFGPQQAQQAQSSRPDQAAMAVAIERRLQAEREKVASTAAASQHTPFDANHEKRQEFRKMVDPGILRPNPRPVALESLKTLLMLAENVIQHSGDPKYQKFKPTNAIIKRTLVDPKGTLEYAVALGFHPQVENFQPFYIFHERHMNDLQIGTAVIKEALEREQVKEVQEQQRRANEKAAHEEAVAKVKQAFYDDRKGRAMVDERERVQRAAQAARRAAGLSSEPEVADHRRKHMFGAGRTLSGEVVEADDEPGDKRHIDEEEEEDDE